MPAAAASPFLLFLISLPQHVSSPEKEHDGDLEFPLAFKKEAVLSFTRVNKLSGKEKAEIHWGLPVTTLEQEILTLRVAHEATEAPRRGGAQPRSHREYLFLALISFSFHNFVLSAQLYRPPPEKKKNKRTNLKVCISAIEPSVLRGPREMQPHKFEVRRPPLEKSVKMPSFMHMPTLTSKRLYSQG